MKLAAFHITRRGTPLTVSLSGAHLTSGHFITRELAYTCVCMSEQMYLLTSILLFCMHLGV